MTAPTLVWWRAFPRMHSEVSHYSPLREDKKRRSTATHRLYRKLLKSFFGLHKVPWLGQIVNEDGVRPDPAKTEVIADWPRPQNMKEMQSFLGFAT